MSSLTASLSRPIVAVDVDLTVVDMGRAHWDWLCKKTGEDRPFPEGIMLPYNLGECFGVPEEAMEFWRQEDLYDNLTPLPGSVEVLEHMATEFDVIFVSAAKGLHNKSKWCFLEKWFPFLSGYIATKEKQYVRCNVLIDDRASYLAKMPENVVTIQKITPYLQEDQYKDFKPWFQFDNWEEVKGRI